MRKEFNQHEGQTYKNPPCKKETDWKNRAGIKLGGVLTR